MIAGVSLLWLCAPDENGLAHYFVHQRRFDKKVYPGLWGLGSGGKAENFESALTAIIRETKEELGLDLIPYKNHVQHLLHYPWQDNQIQYNGDLFLVQIPRLFSLLPLEPCAREFSNWHWANKSAVNSMNLQGLLCPDTAWCWKKMSHLVS